MEAEMIAVQRLFGFSDQDLASINKLIPQLSSSALLHTTETLEKVLKQEHHHIFVARDNSPEGGGKIVGMAAIFFEDRLEGWLGEIHSVAVDSAYRGRPIGDQIISQLV